MTSLKRLNLIKNFKTMNSVISIGRVNDEDDAQFSMAGCDICMSGGNNVYDCEGYSPKHKKVLKLGEVCHACLCIEANGIE